MKINYCFLALVVLSSVLLSCSDDFADNPNSALSITAVAPMPVARASSVAFSIKDKAYVTFGRSGSDDSLAHLRDVWAYDTLTNLWTRKNYFPGQGRVKAIAAVVNDVAYAGLGFSNDTQVYQNKGYLHDFWAYYPESDTWKQLADIPETASTDACVCFVINGLIYVGSGFNGHFFCSDFWCYNPASNTWKELNSFPGTKRSNPTVVCDGTSVFFGTGYHTENLNDWWEYFPESDTWKQKSSVPTKGRVNAISIYANGHFFTGTGRYFHGSLTGGCIMNDVLEYNPAKDIWYKAGHLPASGRENAVSFRIGRRVYIGLGENDSQLLNDFWSFIP